MFKELFSDDFTYVGCLRESSFKWPSFKMPVENRVQKLVLKTTITQWNGSIVLYNAWRVFFENTDNLSIKKRHCRCYLWCDLLFLFQSFSLFRINWLIMTQYFDRNFRQKSHSGYFLTILQLMSFIWIFAWFPQPSVENLTV